MNWQIASRCILLHLDNGIPRPDRFEAVARCHVVSIGDLRLSSQILEMTGFNRAIECDTNFTRAGSPDRYRLGLRRITVTDLE